MLLCNVNNKNSFKIRSAVTNTLLNCPLKHNSLIAGSTTFKCTFIISVAQQHIASYLFGTYVKFMRYSSFRTVHPYHIFKIHISLCKKKMSCGWSLLCFWVQVRRYYLSLPIFKGIVSRDLHICFLLPFYKYKVPSHYGTIRLLFKFRFRTNFRSIKGQQKTYNKIS
jgi:hypothetical protein